jgi:hypothetical protein
MKSLRLYQRLVPLYWRLARLHGGYLLITWGSAMSGIEVTGMKG